MIEEIKSLVPVDKVYDDALSPAMKQIGKALEGVAKTSRFLFAPIDYLASQHDRWQRHLQKIADKVPEENLIEGQPAIVIPVLESLSLQQDGSLLSELFINLLVASIDSTKQGLAHPAFPNIIKQLSQDEAILLFYLKKRHIFFNIIGNIEVEKETAFKENEYYTEGFIKDKLLYPQHLLSYLKHLSSLEITNNSYPDAGIYFGGMKSNLYFPRNSFMQISAFGKLFADACVPNEFEGF